jgi:hypothetical protein
VALDLPGEIAMAVRELTDKERGEIAARALKGFREQMGLVEGVLQKAGKQLPIDQVIVEVDRFTDENGVPKIKFHNPDS